MSKHIKYELMRLARRKNYLLRCIKVSELVEQYENEVTIRTRVFVKYIKPVMSFSYVTFNNMLNEKNPKKEIETIDKEMEEIRLTNDFKYKRPKIQIPRPDNSQLFRLYKKKAYLIICMQTQDIASTESINKDISSKLYNTSEFEIKFGCKYDAFLGRMNVINCKNRIESIDDQIKVIKMERIEARSRNIEIANKVVNSTPKRALIIESVVPVDGGW